MSMVTIESQSYPGMTGLYVNVTLHCPQCGSPRIDVQSVSMNYGRARAEVWAEEGMPEIEWENDEEDSYIIGFWCKECGHDFTDEDHAALSEQVQVGEIYGTAEKAVAAMLSTAYGAEWLLERKAQ